MVVFITGCSHAVCDILSGSHPIGEDLVLHRHQPNRGSW